MARYPDQKTTIIILSNQENTPLGTIRREITKKLFAEEQAVLLKP